MIVQCAGCGARYDVDDSEVPAAGRKVQCSRCWKSWHETPSHRPILESEALATPQPQASISVAPTQTVHETPPQAPPRAKPSVQAPAPIEKPSPPPAPPQPPHTAPATLEIEPNPVDAGELDALSLDSLTEGEPSAEVTELLSESAPPETSEATQPEPPPVLAASETPNSETAQKSKAGGESDIQTPQTGLENEEDIALELDSETEFGAGDVRVDSQPPDPFLDDIDLELGEDALASSDSVSETAEPAQYGTNDGDFDDALSSPDLTELADFLGDGDLEDLDDDFLDDLNDEHDSNLDLSDSDEEGPSSLFSDEDDGPFGSKNDSSSPSPSDEKPDEEEEEVVDEAMPPSESMFSSIMERLGASYITLGSLYGWAALIAILAGVTSGSYLMRNEIVNALPAAKLVYERLELPTKFVRANLEIVEGQTKFYRTSTPAGDSLTIAGVIRNRSDVPERTRVIRIDMLDEYGKVLQSEVTSPIQGLLLPGEESLFQADIHNPAEAVVDAALTFTDEDAIVDVD